MSFGAPDWFWAMALLPVLLVFFLRNERRRGKLLGQLVAARLQERLAGSVSVARRRWRFALLLFGLACVITSLAQPRLGYTWEQSKRKGRDVILAIDCSRSMLATDLAPNRLGRARLAAQDLIGQLQGDRIGLVAFAGSAFLQAPLTVDYGAVLNSLTELDTSIIPRGGTNIAGAIKEAVDAFGKGESDNRCLIIFTDGEELDADGIAAAEAQKDRMKIFTVGLGSTDGSLIPLPGGDGGASFVKDESGQIVKSRLDEERLRKIAEATGGFYVHLQNGPAEMQQIVRTGLGQMKEQEIDARMSRRPIERYQWPLAAGLAFLVGSTLLSERKRGSRHGVAPLRTAALVAALLSASGLNIHAEWKNPGVELYQRGQEPLQRGAELAQKNESDPAEQEFAKARREFEGAYQEFSQQLRRQPDSPELNFNLGAAAYKLGKNEEALLAFGKATLTDKPNLRVDAESNIASTLYRKGLEKLTKDAAKSEQTRKDVLKDWKDGLKHYDDALNVQPENRLVQGHREFLRQQIEKLEQEPPKSDNQKQHQKNEQDKKQDQKDQKEQQQSPDKQQGKDPQDQQKKQDQKSDPQKQDSKDQQNQPKDGSGKDQPPQDQKSEGEKKESEPQKGEKGDEKTDSKSDPADRGEQGQQAKNEKTGDLPPPAAKGDPAKKQGEIQPAQGSPPQTDPQQEQAAEERAAAEGKMTEAQARSLLESLKSEDDRVQLLKPGERKLGRALRDW